MHVRYACMMYAGKQAGMYVDVHHIARELIIASETLFSAASKRKERSGLQTRSCAPPKRVEMMPGRPQVNTKIGKSSISRPLVNDYFELVLQVLPSTLKFNTTPVKLMAPTKMPNNLV